MANLVLTTPQRNRIAELRKEIRNAKRAPHKLDAEEQKQLDKNESTLKFLLRGGR